MGEKRQHKIKILVACHKADPNIRQDDIYMPIQVGKALHPELDLGFQCDNTGDNISEKNGSYCELTALYWAWKNLKDLDYIGLCHYRRYFDFRTLGSSVRIIDSNDIPNLNDLNPDVSKLRKDKIILPSFWSCPTSIWKNFINNVMAEDLYILYKVIAKYSPDYIEAFEKYMLGNRRTGYNMFIMSWENFTRYCEWVFSILERVELASKPSQYISYLRLLGYLGEILLPVYCFKNNIKIKKQRIAFSNGSSSKLYTYGKRQIKNIAYDISYFFSKIPKVKTLKNDYWEQYLKFDKINI